MKKFLVVVAVAVIVAFAATSAMALVANTKHNLGSAVYYAPAGGLSACQYCHTPHNANTAVTAAPLWNKNVNANPYTVYGGGVTLSGTAVNQPGDISKACLSCHDGTMAVDATLTPNSVGGTVANAGGTVTAGIISGAALIGTNLADDHPVGMLYRSTTINPTSVAGLSTTVAAAAPYTVNSTNYIIFGGTDGAGSVECASCHEPHDNTNPPFLRGSIATICTDCHSTK